MEERKLVQAAARIGRFFHIDPVAVLDDAGTFRYAVRAAAYNYMAEVERDAEEKRAASVKKS